MVLQNLSKEVRLFQNIKEKSSYLEYLRQQPYSNSNFDKNSQNINQAFLFYPYFFEIFSYYCKNQFYWPLPVLILYTSFDTCCNTIFLHLAYFFLQNFHNKNQLHPAYGSHFNKNLSQTIPLLICTPRPARQKYVIPLFLFYHHTSS